MRRWWMAGLAALALTGCTGAGYLHSHPHLCPDGTARSHRHWHPDDGRGGHHAPEGGDPEWHRESTWSD